MFDVSGNIGTVTGIHALSSMPKPLVFARVPQHNAQGYGDACDAEMMISTRTVIADSMEQNAVGSMMRNNHVVLEIVLKPGLRSTFMYGKYNPSLPAKVKTFRSHIALKLRASHYFSTWLLNVILTGISARAWVQTELIFHTRLAEPAPPPPPLPPSHPPPRRTPCPPSQSKVFEAPRIQCESLQTGKPAENSTR